MKLEVTEVVDSVTEELGNILIHTHPQFSEVESGICDYVEHMCTTHQWFPIRAGGILLHSSMHSTNHTALLSLHFCKSLYVKAGKIREPITHKEKDE